MGRILAIDYGLRRTGLAVSDPLQIIAGALDTVPTSELMPYLKRYVAANEVSTIVVGKPKRMDGSMSDSWKQIEPFVGRLRREFSGIDVVLYDERFTSVLAHRTMLERCRAAVCSPIPVENRTGAVGFRRRSGVRRDEYFPPQRERYAGM